MDIKRIFPISYKACTLKDFLVALITYLIVDVICSFVIGLLVKIPLIGGVFGLIGTVIGIYIIIGLVIAILVFLNVIK